MKKSILLILLLVLIFNPAAVSYAATYPLNIEYSGGTSPAGPAPWLTATFADLSTGPLNTVQLTLDASGLTGNEFVSSWYFNFNPQYNSFLFVSFAGGTGPEGAVSSLVQNAFSAGPAQGFDFEIDFPIANSPDTNRFTSGETVLYTFDGAGLTAADFEFQNASGAGPFFSAAHVQSIATGSGSGWIGTGTVVVPEPSTLLLLAVGCSSFGLFARRRKP